MSFSANGFFFDFSSINLGLLGLKRLPEELMSVSFGDGITRPDIEGTGQVAIGAGRGRYKCNNLKIKTSLEAYLEIWNSPSLPQDGKGNKIFPVSLTLQQEGAPQFKVEFPESSLITQPFNFGQTDACLAIEVEFKTRYMTINGACLGNVVR